MTNFTIIRHTTENKPTLYNEKGKPICIISKRAMDIILKNYIIYCDQSWNLITQGQTYFKLAKKF